MMIAEDCPKFWRMLKPRADGRRRFACRWAEADVGVSPMLDDGLCDNCPRTEPLPEHGHAIQWALDASSRWWSDAVRQGGPRLAKRLGDFEEIEYRRARRRFPAGAARAEARRLAEDALEAAVERGGVSGEDARRIAKERWPDLAENKGGP